MKVLRTKEQISYDGESPNLKAYIYLRIAGEQTNFLTGNRTIYHQYYRVENGIAYVVKTKTNETVLTKEEWEELRLGVLVGDLQKFDNLSSVGHQTALYYGALYKIAEGQIFGTLPQDWEIITLDPGQEPIHTNPVLF